MLALLRLNLNAMYVAQSLKLSFYLLRLACRQWRPQVPRHELQRAARCGPILTAAPARISRLGIGQRNSRWYDAAGAA